MTDTEFFDLENTIQKISYEIVDMDASYNDAVRRQVNNALNALQNLERYYWALKDRRMNDE